MKDLITDKVGEVAPPEDQSSHPSTHIWQFTLSIVRVPGNPMFSSPLCGCSHKCGTHSHRYTHIHIRIKKFLKIYNNGRSCRKKNL